MQSENLRHKPVLIAHPTGNANVRQAVRTLSDADALAGFHTTICWDADAAFNRLLPDPLRAELLRRSYPGIPRNLIHTHPWNEGMRLAARKLWPSLIRHETGPFCMDAVSGHFDRSVARAIAHPTSIGQQAAAIYAYDDCALHSFKAAKDRGLRCIFELPIGYYRAYQKIVAEELELCPQWSSTFSEPKDSAEKLQRKDEEIKSADLIVVASSFTAKTLESFHDPFSAPIVTIPYGSPTVGPPRLPTLPQAPLRVLFVGIPCQRKGIHYLLEAMKRLQVPCTLTLVGNTSAMPPTLRNALTRHRWIESLPHEKVLEVMRGHDVLVFPSLFEGFGLVILEAMAQGTVVIATPHTAAPDIYRNGEGGFIVPIRSSDAIAARLTQLAEDRDLLASMSEQARRIASECSWERYRARLLSVLDDFLAAF